MTLAIIGSRSFTNSDFFSSIMGSWFPVANGSLTVVSGGAKGADSLGAAWAKLHGHKLIKHLPDWTKHGKAAGFIRNEDIVRDADVVVCFWDGVSRGTQHSLGIAKRLKKPTLIYYV